MIWDCFLYNGEERLLEIRLYELAPVVDGFIIVEGHVTHQGQPKPWHFDWIRNQSYKIRYMGVILPNQGDLNDEEAAENEVYQRNQIGHAVKDDDIVILSDLDEIPYRETVEKLVWRWKHFDTTPPTKIRCKTCYYYLNQEGPAPFSEYGPIVARGFDVKRATPQMLRACIYSPDMPTIDGGWHFTYLGDITEKMESVAHHHPDHKEKYIKALRGDVGELTAFTNPLPHLVREHPEKYKDWILS